MGRGSGRLQAGSRPHRRPARGEKQGVVGNSGGDCRRAGSSTPTTRSTDTQVWRFNTIPAGGRAGQRDSGVDRTCSRRRRAWITGTYDPELNLIYWGIGNPNPDTTGRIPPGRQPLSPLRWWRSMPTTGGSGGTTSSLRTIRTTGTRTTCPVIAGSPPCAARPARWWMAGQLQRVLSTRSRSRHGRARSWPSRSRATKVGARGWAPNGPIGAERRRRHSPRSWRPPRPACPISAARPVFNPPSSESGAASSSFVMARETCASSAPGRRSMDFQGRGRVFMSGGMRKLADFPISARCAPSMQDRRRRDGNATRLVAGGMMSTASASCSPATTKGFSTPSRARAASGCGGIAPARRSGAQRPPSYMLIRAPVCHLD